MSDEQRSAKFHQEVSDAFSNYGTDKRGFLLSTELDAPLRQLALPLDMKAVQDLLARQNVDSYDLAAFLDLVHSIIGVLQRVSDAREAVQKELGTDACLAVLQAHAVLIEALFAQYAPARAGAERAIGTESLVDMSRDLCLIPQRFSEDRLRSQLHSTGFDWIPLAVFPEVLLALAYAYAGDKSKAAAHERLHELLVAIERVRAESQALGSAERTRMEEEAQRRDPPDPPDPPDQMADVSAAGVAHEIDTCVPQASQAGHMPATQPSGSLPNPSLPMCPNPSLPSRPMSMSGPRHPSPRAAAHGGHARVARKDVQVATAPMKRMHARDGSQPAAPFQHQPRTHPQLPPHATLTVTDPTTEAELAATREHVASLENNLLQAERRLREAGVFATRIKPAYAPGSEQPSYRFHEQKELTTDSEHAQTLEQFARMRQTVASLAARNKALEQTKKRTVENETNVVARESALVARERALRKDVDALRKRNRELETMVLAATKEAKAEKAAANVLRRNGELSEAERLIDLDGKREVSFAPAADGSQSDRGVGDKSMAAKLALSEETVAKLRSQLAASQRENGALRGQVEQLEEQAHKKLFPDGGPPGSGADGSLLEYAASMKMRPLGSAGGGGAASAGSGVRASRAARGAGGTATLQALHHEWVDTVTGFSSERDDDAYAARQLVGPPRVYPMHGHAAGAWQPKSAGAGSKTEYVEVRFANPLYISAIEVYECFGAGAVVSIALWSGESSGWDVVWKGEATGANLPKEARLFAPPLAQRGYAAQHARIEMQLRAGGDGASAQLDAIRAVGMRAPRDAAAKESPRGSGKKEGGAAKVDDQPFAVPGSPTAAMTVGPRYRQLEVELRSLKEGHAREMKSLKAYILQLRDYGEQMRTELDKTRGELEAHREELRARPPRSGA